MKILKNKYLWLVAIIFIMLSGCAPAENVSDCILLSEPYGFWGGLWHGIIITPAFILSLFTDDVALYAIDNNGGWYNFGFVLGAGSTFRIFR